MKPRRMNFRIKIAFALVFLSGMFFGTTLDSLLNKLKNSPKNDTGKVMLLFNIGREYVGDGNYNGGKKVLDQALHIADSLKFKRGLSKVYNGLAIVNKELGDYPAAIDYQFKSLRLCEEAGNKAGEATAYLNLGNTYCYTNDWEQGKQCFIRSKALAAELKDEELEYLCLGNIAAVFNAEKKLDSAEIFYKQAMEYYMRKNMKPDMAQTYMNLGALEADRKNYTGAMKVTFKALELYREVDDRLSIALIYSNLGAMYIELKDYKKAIAWLDSGLIESTRIGSKDKIMITLRGLASAYSKIGNYEKAISYYERSVALNDSMLSEGNSRNIEEMQARFDTEKKEKEIELMSKDKNIRALLESERDSNIKRQRWLIYSFIAGFILFLVLGFFILKGLNARKKLNQSLARKNEEFNSQKNQIEEKNRLIGDSIEYARDIQSAVLPSSELIAQLFPSSFIFYLPKDIVSGDFYWTKKANGKNYFAIVDCTGHGVPGAFMSVMVLNLLENILDEQKGEIARGAKNIDTSPAAILEKLNTELTDALKDKKSEGTSKYGMDIALCALSGGKTLEYAGAHHPLYILRNNKITEIRGEGIFIGMESKKFTNHTAELLPGDSVFVFSDGIVDQFGGNPREKLFSFRFKEWLQEFSGKTSAEQYEFLKQKFYEWKGNEEQIDDILVMGITV